MFQTTNQLENMKNHRVTMAAAYGNKILLVATSF